MLVSWCGRGQDEYCEFLLRRRSSEYMCGVPQNSMLVLMCKDANSCVEDGGRLGGPSWYRRDFCASKEVVILVLWRVRGYEDGECYKVPRRVRGHYVVVPFNVRLIF